MRGIFLDAGDGMDAVFHAVSRPTDPPCAVNVAMDIAPDDLPRLLSGHDFMLNDHTFLPTAQMAQCVGLRHVIFLGTGAASYMDVPALEALGIQVHTIKGYGDTAVAEHAIALMWSAVRGLARMDRDMRAGLWTRVEGRQLTGKTLGLIGYGGIAAEMARIATGSGMRVIAWNRTPRQAPNVEFVPLDTLLAESHVVSLHLLLNDDTRGFLNQDRIARMRQGAILINTARSALLDQPALIAALQSGALSHAALDVFDHEPPLPEDPITKVENVTLSAHSGFSTPEARETLVRRALDIAAGLTAG